MPPKKKFKGETSGTVSKANSEGESDDGANDNKQKRGRKKPTIPKADKTPKALQNQSSTEFKNQDFENCSTTKNGLSWNLKIASWNVDGLRAWIKVF